MVPGTITTKPKEKIMTHISETPTIWYKNQRVWRTLFSGTLALLSVIPTVLAIINAEFEAEWLTVAAAQVLAVQAVVTRIMAIEEVNRWLAYIGLGSAPKAALIDARD